MPYLVSVTRGGLVSGGGGRGGGVGLGVQDSSGLSLKVLAGNCCLPGSPPMSQSQLLNHLLWLVPLGKGRPGIQEATCPNSEMASSAPSRQSPALSLVSCQSALPREGRGG